jgi:hypothetical protein
MVLATSSFQDYVKKGIHAIYLDTAKKKKGNE